MEWGTGKHKLIGSLAGALLVAACSSGEPTVITEADDPPSEPTESSPIAEPSPSLAATDDTPVDELENQGLDTVTLALDTAPQLSRVGLVGLDPAIDTTSLAATYEISDGDWWGSRVLVDADGPYLLAPLYAPDPATGGAVDLHLSDGTHSGPALALTLAPMPVAPGAFDDALAALESAIGGLAAELGTGLDELSSGDGNVPTSLAPLQIALAFLDETSGARGAYDALDSDDAELIDAIAGQIDIGGGLDDEAFEALSQFIPETVTGQVSQGLVRARTGDTGRTTAPANAFASLTSPRQSGADCIPFYAEGGGALTAGRLSEMMTGSAMSDIAVNPNGAPGQTFAALEATMSLGAALEAGATGGKGKVYDTFGKMAGGWKLFNSMRAGLLPSSFTRIEAELDPGDLEEDRPQNKPGRWPKVNVWATSTGYTLDGDIAGELAGAFGGEFLGTRLPESAGDAVDDGIGWAQRLDDAVDVTDINNAAGADPIKNAVNEFLPPEGVIRFCPQEFTADIGDGPWTWARPQQDLLTVDNDARTYVNTKAIGTDTLAIGPLPNKFGQKSIYAYLPVETHAIDVQVDRDEVWVTRPGEPAEISATIEWADDTRLAWVADQGSWAGSGGGYFESEGGGTQVLNTPDNADAFGDDGIRVEVESLSRQNLRRDGDPIRYDFVYVKLAPFTIEPNPGNTVVEQQLTFGAFDAEGQPIEVEWSATGGQIPSGPSATALYIAGRQSGQYTVTGRLPGTDIEFTVVVNVGDRDCILGNWELDMPRFVAAMNAQADDGSVSYISGDSQIIIRDNGTATWNVNDVRMAVNADGQTFTLVWNSSTENSYSAEGGVFTGTGGTATVDVLIEEFGRRTTVSVPSAVGGGATYECKPRESLVVNVEGGTLFLTYNGPA